VPEILVDLFSDTMTKPSEGMRRAMAEAEVGDEQKAEDPTTNRLQEMVAEMLSQEAAVFLPSGTMCNEIAYAVHCQPGDEIILDATAHGLTSEAGGPAVLARAVLSPLQGRRGVFDAAQLKGAIRAPTRYAPRSRLVAVEQTSNLGGGTVWPLALLAEVTEVAHSAGLLTHCDGARVLNAVVASGTPAPEFGRHFDSIWLDLSKGLGAPVGAVLAGPRDFIDRAWRWKQRLGGALRQSGVLAAAGLYALEHNVERLAEDHANARVLAEAIAALPGVQIEPDTVETNIVIFDVSDSPLSAPEIAARTLRDHGVRLCPLSPTTIRVVTHLDVSRAGIDAALEAMATVMRA
jgi:threonine aldolase